MKRIKKDQKQEDRFSVCVTTCLRQNEQLSKGVQSGGGQKAVPVPMVQFVMFAPLFCGEAQERHKEGMSRTHPVSRELRRLVRHAPEHARQPLQIPARRREHALFARGHRLLCSRGRSVHPAFRGSRVPQRFAVLEPKVLPRRDRRAGLFLWFGGRRARRPRPCVEELFWPGRGVGGGQAEPRVVPHPDVGPGGPAALHESAKRTVG